MVTGRANKNALQSTIVILPRAIIGDGDGKSWDPRAPITWDSFSSFRTNCTILTNISARIHAHAVGSRVDIVTLRDQMVTERDSLLDFSQRLQGIKQGTKIRTLICSFML